MSGETYKSQDARDAQAYGYGDKRYWDYLEQSSLKNHAYFTERGDHERAALMLTRSLSQALMGNDGD